MTHIIILLLTISCITKLLAQTEENTEYRGLMDQSKFTEAQKIIKTRLNNIYAQRTDNKRIPTDFITIDSAEEGIDLNKLFRKRKVKGFFIEENAELYTLHFDLARSYYETKEYDKALNNYYQALRFRSFKDSDNNPIFYQIAWAFKQSGQQEAYLHTLETAYKLNDKNSQYSLELGKALYKTRKKKKAILHLNKYLEAQNEDIKDLSIYTMLANLNEDLGRYLETSKYLTKYLEKKPDDPYVIFSLAYNAYKHIGNHELAQSNFKKSLALLPENDIFRRSKAYEYIADIDYDNLHFKDAITSYLETIKYQEKVAKEIEEINNKIQAIEENIKKMKAGLLKEKNYLKYNEYQFQNQEQQQLMYEKTQKEYQYRKLNSGKVRMRLARSYEKLEDYPNALQYYRQAIFFNYKPNIARANMKKLQLKIKRGY